MSHPKPPIERAAIQEALKAGYPLYWEPRHGWLRLYAVTYTWENGSCRRRKIFSTESEQEARTLNTLLVRQGAKIDGDELHKIIRVLSYPLQD
jgi:hypothetical protein